MRTYEEYHHILTLWEAGENKFRIERITGIPRATVRDCIKRYGNLAGLEADRNRATRSTPDEVLFHIQAPDNATTQSAYAYMLGMYLGDGYIVRNNRVYFLRIALDNRYPNIIRRCVDSLHTILPENKVNVLQMKKGNWVEVVCTRNQARSMAAANRRY
jgi:hypothetical protein